MNALAKATSVSGLRRGVGARQPGADPSVSAPAEADATLPPRPAKPVRFTLDLDQRQHTDLKRFAVESGAGVGGSKVIRALLDELQADPELAARVRARIWAAKR